MKLVKQLVGTFKTHQNNDLSTMANSISDGNTKLLAEDNNSFFTSISSKLPPLLPNNTFSAIKCDIPNEFIISVKDVETNLSRMKLGKSPGSDEFLGWMLRDFTPILAPPSVHFLISDWLGTDTYPLCKNQPMWRHSQKGGLPLISIKILRPILLTSPLAKELERFVMAFLRKATQGKLDTNQYGNQTWVSTTHLLVGLLDSWLKALDAPNTSVGVVFLDYTKAFDRINHYLLTDKIEPFNPHPCVLRWIAAFLQGRQQSVKYGDTTSSLCQINRAVPKGALLGMEAFELMISDLTSCM